MSLVLNLTFEGQLVIWLIQTEPSTSEQHDGGVSPSGQLCIVGNGHPSMSACKSNS